MRGRNGRGGEERDDIGPQWMVEMEAQNLRRLPLQSGRAGFVELFLLPPVAAGAFRRVGEGGAGADYRA